MRDTPFSAGQSAPLGRPRLPSLLCPLQARRAISQGQVFEAGDGPYFVESNCILIGLDAVGPYESTYSTLKRLRTMVGTGFLDNACVPTPGAAEGPRHMPLCWIRPSRPTGVVGCLAHRGRGLRGWSQPAGAGRHLQRFGMVGEWPFVWSGLQSWPTSSETLFSWPEDFLLWSPELLSRGPAEHVRPLCPPPLSLLMAQGLRWGPTLLSRNPGLPPSAVECGRWGPLRGHPVVGSPLSRRL